ncbi:hypothetical protein [Psychrobacter cryohalolentis]|uniref:hypothetical protein n=1 Tax=Psychrobacter cryohalolentis TaxID=330922 RepID=UPI003F844AA7
MPSDSTMVMSDGSYLMHEMACYLRADILKIILPDMPVIESNYQAQYSQYQLPLGDLNLVELVIYLPNDMLPADIEALGRTAFNAVNIWRKTHISRSMDSQLRSIDVLVLDIQRQIDIDIEHDVHNKSCKKNPVQRLAYSFTDSNLVQGSLVDTSASIQPLQAFGWHDWHIHLNKLQIPCELWRFLYYRLGQSQQGNKDHITTSKNDIITGFLNVADFFAPAITIDNALIKYGLQNEPNSALIEIAMSLAQKTNSPTKQMYQQHMAQAAALWSQLSMQMLETVYKNPATFEQKESSEKSIEADFSHWQQQILDESLFSRHELIRTLYKHPKQAQQLQQQGYVVHQHSYECLGRHYVLIFYGQDAEGKHGKLAIRPNLAKIALDVATRLPMAELHHVVVLGIDFIIEAEDAFMDIDLWIQPVNPMTQRERQLTKKVQQLQQSNQSNASEITEDNKKKTDSNHLS